MHRPNTSCQRRALKLAILTEGDLTSGLIKHGACLNSNRKEKSHSDGVALNETVVSIAYAGDGEPSG